MKAPTVGCSSWCWGGLFLADASSQEPLGPGWGRVSPEKAGGGAGSVAGRGAGRRRRSPGRRRMWVSFQILDSRLEICRDRRDRQSCKIFPSCVKFWGNNANSHFTEQFYTVTEQCMYNTG